MPDFGPAGGSRHDTAGAVLASSTGTTIAAAGSANVKGSWTQLIAATPFPVAELTLIMTATFSGARMLIDIGIGAAASEVVLIPDVHIATAANTRWGSTALHRIPATIPAGTRIAARCQASTSTVTSLIVLLLHAPTFGTLIGGGPVTAYGVNAADSGGTAVDPGATINTKGAWVELSAATTRDIRTLILLMQHDGVSVATTATWLVDVGVGGAGSEVVVVPDVLTRAGNLQHVPEPNSIGVSVAIPAGSRLAVRCQSSFATATERLLDIVLYGVS